MDVDVQYDPDPLTADFSALLEQLDPPVALLKPLQACEVPCSLGLGAVAALPLDPTFGDL